MVFLVVCGLCVACLVVFVLCFLGGVVVWVFSFLRVLGSWVLWWLGVVSEVFLAFVFCLGFGVALVGDESLVPGVVVLVPFAMWVVVVLPTGEVHVVRDEGAWCS